MAGLEFHRIPEDAVRYHLPLGPVTANSQPYDSGDPVRIVANQILGSLYDATIVQNTEFMGFACEGSGGVTAASRTTNAADGFGSAEDQIRTFIRANTPGLQMRTRNWWDTGAPGTQTGRPTGADVGTTFDLVNSVAGTRLWGLEDTAPAGADLTCIVDEVLDANMNPIISTDTTTGVWAVFRVIGTMQGV